MNKFALYLCHENGKNWLTSEYNNNTGNVARALRARYETYPHIQLEIIKLSRSEREKKVAAIVRKA